MPLTFSTNITPYARGRRVNAEEWNTITRVMEGTTPVGFGVPVIRGTGPKQCKPYAADENAIIGITEADLTLDHVPADQFQQYDNVPVCESGVIGVLAGGNVVAGEGAAYSAAANSGAGGWIDASSAGDRIPGAVFETSGSAGQVVALRYRRPNTNL